VVGREYVLWSRGILDRLPPEVGHAVVDGWVDGDETVIVMRDLGDSVLTWADRLTRGRCRWMLTRVAAQHRAFLGAAPDYLTPLPNLIALFAPDRMAPFVNSTNPLAAIYIRGWEVFGETVPAEVADPVFALLTDPKPLGAWVGNNFRDGLWRKKLRIRASRERLLRNLELSALPVERGDRLLRHFGITDTRS
jgi:hypothetical protein